MQLADDFIENVVSASCDIAKHRHSDTLEVKDVQLYLDRAWNMWVPGFGSDELRPYKRAPTTEAHKQVRPSRFQTIVHVYLYQSTSCS